MRNMIDDIAPDVKLCPLCGKDCEWVVCGNERWIECVAYFDDECDYRTTACDHRNIDNIERVALCHNRLPRVSEFVGKWKEGLPKLRNDVCCDDREFLIVMDTGKFHHVFSDRGMFYIFRAGGDPVATSRIDAHAEIIPSADIILSKKD